MPDEIFTDSRLAALYDTFEEDRSDLLPYLRLVHEVGAHTVVDVGCGTGSFALLASASGMSVLAVDPAGASVAVARTKPGADHVCWHVGTAATAPVDVADVAVLTGNVVQAIIDDADLLDTFAAIHERLHPHGVLLFETRRPEARAWVGWAEPFFASHTFAQFGYVTQRRELLSVQLPLVSFRLVYDFPDGTTIISDSTLRFRTDDECRRLLSQSGFEVVELRDAPDRPGAEYVYLARKRD